MCHSSVTLRSYPPIDFQVSSPSHIDYVFKSTNKLRRYLVDSNVLTRTRRRFLWSREPSDDQEDAVEVRLDELRLE